MRKWTALIAASLLGCSAMLLSACQIGGRPVNNDGTIDGNYSKPSDIEFLQVVNSIRPEKVFGDALSDEWKFGAEYITDIYTSVRQDENNWKNKKSLFYQFVLGRDAETGEMLRRGTGFGKWSFSVPANVLDEDIVTYAAEASFCNDSQFFYQDKMQTYQVADQKEQTQFKNKTSLDELEIPGGEDSLFGLPVILLEKLLEAASGETTDDSFTDGMTLDDVAFMREKLDDYGIVLEADLSDGVKLKLSASEETVEMLFASALGNGEAFDRLEETAEEAESDFSVEFSQCMYEIYYAVDADGLLSGVSVRADIEAVLKGLEYNIVTGQPMEDGADIAVTIRGKESLSSYKGTVKLPEDLESYEEIPAEDEVLDPSEESEHVIPDLEFVARFNEIRIPFSREIWDLIQ